MSSYRNITENMWSDLNHVGLIKRSKNMSELEEFCKEEQGGEDLPMQRQKDASLFCYLESVYNCS